MHFGTGEEFPYVECAGCGCLQIAAVPDDLARFYPPTYYSFAPEGRKSAISRLVNVLRIERNKYALFHRSFIGKMLYTIWPAEPIFGLISTIGDLREKTILDVGSGCGWLVNKLAEAGCKHVAGIDPFISTDIKTAAGAIIHKKTLTSLTAAASYTYDLIMFNHSLEHMPDQYTAIHSAAALLRSGGTLLIRVPTVGSYAWRHYGTNWVQLDAPRHLYLHSTRSMALLAERVGLSVEQTLYDSNELQFCGSEQYLQGIPLTSPRSYLASLENSMFTPRDISRYRNQAQELNQKGEGDMAAFFLRRRDG